MDIVDYTKGCAEVADGLEKLSESLYKALKNGYDEATKIDLLKRSEAKLKQIDEFLAILPEFKKNGLTEDYGDYFDNIRERSAEIKKRG